MEFNNTKLENDLNLKFKSNNDYKYLEATEVMLFDLKQDMFFHIDKHDISNADQKRYDEIVNLCLKIA